MLNKLITKIKKYGLKYSFLLFLSRIFEVICKKNLNSYSQYGEDVVLDVLIGNKISQYIDIGAFDPDEANNTKKFYLRGWNGINIEPNPDNYKKFVKSRPKDINVNIGIGPKNGAFSFYVFDADMLCTFSKEEAEKYAKTGYRLIRTEKIKVMQLRDVILRYHLGSIGFISVDTEGHDLKVLQSNDWNIFRPTFICVEIIDHTYGIINKEIETYLDSCDYQRVYFNGLNEIWHDKRDLEPSILTKILSCVYFYK
ncbi:MAG: FkbM family methyltransferase [Candidatus Micrarchaeota archaeon]